MLAFQLALFIYVCGVLICVIVGFIQYYTSYRQYEIKTGAKLALYSPIWPLWGVKTFITALIQMKKELEND